MHFDVLVEEFVNSPKRAHAAMFRYRGKRSAWDRFASRLLRTTCKVGYSLSSENVMDLRDPKG